MIKTVPIYEYECVNCGYQIERLEYLTDETHKKNICTECGGDMKRIVSLCQFKLEYNPTKDICDWQGNTSHYWDEVKKQRAEGKDVKPVIDGDKY